MAASAESNAPLLELTSLSVTFDTDDGAVTAVDDVSLVIRPGETVGLVGESGCGKSATALSVLRLLPTPPARISGAIRLGDDNLLSLSADALRQVRGRQIGMIFQEPMTALSPLCRIGDQLVETWQLHTDLSRPDAVARSIEWLAKVGLPEPEARMRDYPFQLSGGMRQRVMIAMAAMLEPQLIVADEPTTALDVTVQAQILALLKTVRPAGSSLLLITHDMGVIWAMCDRVAVMYASKIVESGTVDTVFAQPAHPYTEALLQSVPTLQKGAARLPAIGGQVPSPLGYPAGCRFHDRCPRATTICSADQPLLVQRRNGGEVACHLAED
jgi:peptide/nickel transport system ATP-binding protein/oligopeptide transport system ATP-binding protein